MKIAPKSGRKLETNLVKYNKAHKPGNDSKKGYKKGLKDNRKNNKDDTDLGFSKVFLTWCIYCNQTYFHSTQMN